MKVSLVPSIPPQKRWFEISPSPIKMGAGGDRVAEVALTSLQKAPLGGPTRLAESMRSFVHKAYEQIRDRGRVFTAALGGSLNRAIGGLHGILESLIKIFGGCFELTKGLF